MIKEIEKFSGTIIYDVLAALDSLYNDIENDQTVWKKKSPAQCPDGCGNCCVHFEPEVYEAEALYLAAWMLENQSKQAEYIAELDSTIICTDGCFLFNPDNPHHCTVYGGRCLICRLFGFSSDRGKDLHMRWKPCRHMQPVDGFSGFLRGRQYSEDEMQCLFGGVPPYMGQASSRLLALNPDDTHPHPLRIALPAAIKKLKMLLRFLTPPEPDCPSPHPLSA